MDKQLLESDILETTNYLADLIRRNYEANATGTIKGYLVWDEKQDVILKNQRKYYSTLKKENDSSLILGSVKCSETKSFTKTLTGMLIAFVVRNNLLEIFKEYPFTKFQIILENYPQYRYTNSRIRKYRKTGDDLTYLKADIEW